MQPTLLWSPSPPNAANAILLTASSVLGQTIAADVEVTDVISGERFTAYHEVVTTASESGDCAPLEGQ